MNHAAHIKNGDALTFADPIAERTGAGVLEIGDMINRAAAPTRRCCAKACGAWKSGQRLCPAATGYRKREPRQALAELQSSVLCMSRRGDLKALNLRVVGG